MKFLDRVEAKHPRWGIQNLMMHISILTAVVFVMELFRPAIINYLYLSRDALFSFQLWRLITFVLIPPTTSIFWIIFVLYFYYFIGSALESTWGSLKFTAYYLLCMVATIVAALLSGGAYWGVYVNLSIFLAFAYLYPNQEFLLFFILPIKAKYFAYLDLAFLTYNFFAGDLTTKFAIIASLAGFLIFFGRDLYQKLRLWIRRQKYRNRFK
jgi:membrane associated rhomboid family serine protease